MANLEQMKFAPGEKVDIPDDVPEQFQEFGPPPEPGHYVFRLPKPMTGWEKKEVTVRDKKVERIVHFFKEDNRLTIINSPKGKHNGELFQTMISDIERARDKDKSKYVSDLYYLAKESFGEPFKSGTTPLDHAKVISKHAGEDFGGDIEWSSYCNAEKAIYISVQDGEVTRTLKSDSEELKDTEQFDQKGCGGRMYQKDIAKLCTVNDAGEKVWPAEFTCKSCEVAVLRPFANIARYSKA